MRYFFKSRRFKIFAGIAAALIAVMLIFGAVLKYSSPVSSALSVVASPFQKGASGLSGAVAGLLKNMGGNKQALSENARLKQENAALRKELMDYQTLRSQNDFYKNFLGLKTDHPDFQFTPALAVGSDPADKYKSFSIDKGSLQGVSLHDPVITDAGLVGYISGVNASSATVMTILNPNLSVSCIDRRTRDNGIVSGDPDLAAGGQARMGYIAKSSTVAVNDYAVTSGKGGMFPAGLIVGSMAQIQQSNQDDSIFAVISPAVDLSSIRDVMVVTSFTGQIK